MPIQRAKPRLVDLDQTPLTSFSGLASSDMPAGSLLQVKSFIKTNATTYGASDAHKIMSVELTTKAVNSTFLFFVDIAHGAPALANPDSYNYSFTAGYKTGGASTTVSEYTGFGGRTGASVAYMVSGIGGSDTNPFFASDVVEGHASGTYGTAYQTRQKSHVFQISPNIAAGTLIDFAIWSHVDGGLVISGADFFRTNSNDYSGQVSTIAVQEIKA